MLNEIFKDPGYRMWFKTDEQMVDITDAKEFRVRRGWFSRRFVLQAKFKNPYGSFFEYRWDYLASFGTITEASMDLDKILLLRGWKVLEDKRVS